MSCLSLRVDPRLNSNDNVHKMPLIRCSMLCNFRAIHYLSLFSVQNNFRAIYYLSPEQCRRGLSSTTQDMGEKERKADRVSKQGVGLEG